MKKSFAVEVYNKTYFINPLCESECMMYEVSTACEKLFTLQVGADGNWRTNEPDIIPINKDLIAEIGDAIGRHYTS